MMFKKGDKVTVDWPSKYLYNEPGKIVQKVSKKDYPVSSTMGRTGDWYLVDFGGYDGLLKVYQDYITKESNNMPMKQFEEFTAVNETDYLSFKEQSALAQVALAEMEESLKNISVEVSVAGSKDKVRIYAGEAPGFVKIGNPNRGGAYYNTKDLAALKKALNAAVDKAIVESDKIQAKYKDSIDKIMTTVKKT